MNKTKIIFFICNLITSLCHAQTDDILIQSDGLIITRQMLTEEINANSAERKEFLLASPKKLNEYIDIYYREKLFEHLALQQKIDQRPEYQAMLNVEKRRLLTSLLIEDKKKSIKIPDLTKSAREYYQVNKAQFTIIKQVEARHILLKSKPDDENRDAIRLQLVEILEKIKKDPTQFEALAKKYSEDPGSAVKGGYLGKFSKGRMVEEFDREAFNLSEPGQLTEVFSTKFGFHIIQLIKIYPPTTAPFEQVEEMIKAKLAKEYIDAEYMRWRNKIVDPDKAQVNEAELQNFVQQLLKNETAQ